MSHSLHSQSFQTYILFIKDRLLEVIIEELFEIEVKLFEGLLPLRIEEAHELPQLFHLVGVKRHRSKLALAIRLTEGRRQRFMGN